MHIYMYVYIDIYTYQRIYMCIHICFVYMHMYKNTNTIQYNNKYNKNTQNMCIYVYLTFCFVFFRGPVDNKGLLCEHARFPPASAPLSKRISTRAWDMCFETVSDAFYGHLTCDETLGLLSVSMAACQRLTTTPCTFPTTCFHLT